MLPIAKLKNCSVPIKIIEDVPGYHIQGLSRFRISDRPSSDLSLTQGIYTVFEQGGRLRESPLAGGQALQSDRASAEEWAHQFAGINSRQTTFMIMYARLT